MSSVDTTSELYAPTFAVAWERHHLHDLAQWINGMAFKDIDFSRDGTPVIKIAEVRNGITSQTRFTRAEYDSKYRLRNGDMLFCWSGQPDTSIDTYLWRGGDGWLNQHIFKVEPDDSLVDRGFFYYLMRYLRPTFVRIARNKQTTGLGHVTKGDLRKVTVAVPSRDYQRVLARTLGAIDNKIDSNHRAVALIEALLTNEFQRLRSEEDFAETPLAELVSITKGVSYKSADLQSSRTSLVTLKSFDRNGGYKSDGLKPYVGAYKAEQVIEPGEIVVAQTDLTQGAEVVGRAIRVPAARSADVLVASLDLVIVRPVGGMSGQYLQGILTDDAFRQHCRSRTSGTTVLHLASDAIPTYSAPIVSELAQQAYVDFARPLLQRVDSLNREIVRLAALRDALLPALLSGGVHVPEASDVVEEVLA